MGEMKEGLEEELRGLLMEFGCKCPRWERELRLCGLRRWSGVPLGVLSASGWDERGWGELRRAGG